MGEMRLGYACINTQLPSSARTLRLANVTPGRLRELIGANLEALETILRWNVAHDVRVFRLTSNLVPFGSHPANTIAWWEEFAPQLRALGELVDEQELSLSTHPGQYTVLGSARPEVRRAAVAELDYHGRLFDALGLDASHKIVVHVTGTAEHFADSFRRASPAARSRLVLENDERRSLEDTLELAGLLGVPVVFDAFHQELNPSFAGATVRELVLRAAQTWGPADGRQEVHFSTQEPGKRPGAHAASVDLGALARFEDDVSGLDLDCVLEVKDKEQSVLRAQAARRQAA